MTAHRHIDITGQTFGRLTAIKPIGYDNSRNMKWLCLCICGNTSTPTLCGLRSGGTKSCGCLAAEIYKISSKTHGACINKKQTPEYSCWQNMKARCNNPNHPSYKNYGERGIKVCKRWDMFVNFFEDMGIRPNGLSIERIDNNSGYTISNCIWADRATQRKNQRN